MAFACSVQNLITWDWRSLQPPLKSRYPLLKPVQTRLIPALRQMILSGYRHQPFLHTMVHTVPFCFFEPPASPPARLPIVVTEAQVPQENRAGLLRQVFEFQHIAPRLRLLLFAMP